MFDETFRVVQIPSTPELPETRVFEGTGWELALRFPRASIPQSLVEYEHTSPDKSISFSFRVFQQVGEEWKKLESDPRKK